MGRISDSGKDGLAEIILMKQALIGINGRCKLLIASIRKSNEIIYLAAKGINTFTINTSIAEELFYCEESIKALDKFEQDVESNSG